MPPATPFQGWYHSPPFTTNWTLGVMKSHKPAKKPPNRMPEAGDTVFMKLFPFTGKHPSTLRPALAKWKAHLGVSTRTIRDHHRIRPH
jgi:hypothetical protein